MLQVHIHLGELNVEHLATDCTISMAQAILTQLWTLPTWPLSSKHVHKMGLQQLWPTLTPQLRIALTIATSATCRTIKVFCNQIRSCFRRPGLLQFLLLIALAATRVPSFRALLSQWSTWEILVRWWEVMGRLGWIVRSPMEVKVMNLSGTLLCPIIKSSLITVFYVNN